MKTEEFKLVYHDEIHPRQAAQPIIGIKFHLDGRVYVMFDYSGHWYKFGGIVFNAAYVDLAREDNERALNLA